MVLEALAVQGSGFGRPGFGFGRPGFGFGRPGFGFGLVALGVGGLLEVTPIPWRVS